MKYPKISNISIWSLFVIKPAKYGLLFKSINAIGFPYTFCIVVYAGKPENGSGPFYEPSVIGTVQRLVTKLEESSDLGGRNLSYDR